MEVVVVYREGYHGRDIDNYDTDFLNDPEVKYFDSEEEFEAWCKELSKKEEDSKAEALRLLRSDGRVREHYTWSLDLACKSESELIDIEV